MLSSGSGSGSGSGSSDSVEEGVERKIEFVSDDCLDVEDDEKGEELEVSDCNKAEQWIYRDDHTLLLDGSDDLCVEADDDKLKLAECDSDDDNQKFYFIRMPTTSDYAKYRILNLGTSEFVERDGSKVGLASDDDGDRDQQVKGIGANFFNGMD